MKVVIYVRVSSKEQVEGYSIGEQIERLKAYCAAMGWTVVGVYIDPGHTGANMNRPDLQRMISDVNDGGIDKVVVYKLDRLSRSQKDILYLVEDIFLKNNTDFVSMQESFQTNSPFGRAMVGLLGVFAQLEREQIKERTIMGKEARAKEGKWGGGSTVPIGYEYDEPNDLLVINEYERIQLLELSELFLKGTPLRTIETMFLDKGYKHKYGAWYPKTMRYVLRNKVYCGYIKYQGEYYEAEHTPIWNEETYNKHVTLLDQRAEQYKLTGVKPGTQTTYLGGLLYCKHCGGKYSKQENSRKKPRTLWYTCYSRSKKVKKMVKDPNCKNKNWKMVELDQMVFDEIRKFTVDPTFIKDIKAEEHKKDNGENKVAIIEKEIEKIDAQIDRFMDLYGIGKFTVEQLSGKTDPLNEERAKLVKELKTLNAESGRLTEEEAIEIFETFEETLEYGDFNEIRAMIESLIYYIEIDNEDIYIHWKFA